MEDGFLKLYKVKGYIMGIVYWGHYKPGIWEERAARLYGSSILEWVSRWCLGGRCTIPPLMVNPTTRACREVLDSV